MDDSVSLEPYYVILVDIFVSLYFQLHKQIQREDSRNRWG